VGINLFFIENINQVGINTNAPSKSLDVVGDCAISSLVVGGDFKMLLEKIILQSPSTNTTTKKSKLYTWVIDVENNKSYSID
jgi:hypothetical protein